jgi:hypothetical protein
VERCWKDSNRGLEPAGNRIELLVVQTLVIDPFDPEDLQKLSSFR